MALLTPKNRINSNKRSALKNVLVITLLTGTLDAVAAILMNPKVSTPVLFRFIASGVYGKGAFAGGDEMVTSGIIFHYIIAFLFTTVFYQLYPMFKKAFKNQFVIGIFYGVLAWVVMNFGVIPLSKIGMHPIKLQLIISGMVALVICLGLPIAVIAEWQLSKKNTTPASRPKRS